MSDESLTYRLKPKDVKTTLEIMLLQLRSSKWDGVVVDDQDARMVASLAYWGERLDVSSYQMMYDNIMGRHHVDEKLTSDPGFALRLKYHYNKLDEYNQVIEEVE